jgi:hypothetical protein
MAAGKKKTKQEVCCCEEKCWPWTLPQKNLPLEKTKNFQAGARTMGIFFCFPFLPLAL